MTLTNKIVLSLAISLTLFALGFMFVSMQRPQSAYGSVQIANEYQATSTRQATTGQSMQSYIALTRNCGADVCPGTLGSFVVTGANTGIINIYDATTTGIHSNHGTTTLFVVPASLAAGTYTLDLVYQRGLVFELVSGIMPTTTITYR